VLQFLQSGEFEPMYIQPGRRRQYCVLATPRWKGIESVEQDSETDPEAGKALRSCEERLRLAGMRDSGFKKLKARLSRRRVGSPGGDVGDD
jgi:hypothetical protein